jgi:hypothetical protein
MSTIPSRRVRFGAFELDLSTGELRLIEAPDRNNPSPNNPGPNNKVLLREQVFQVLRMLVEREGRIVTREEIKNTLWVNHTVDDFGQSINATIKALRRSLGGLGGRPPVHRDPGTTWVSIDAGCRISGIQRREPLCRKTEREQREQPAVEVRRNAPRVQAGKAAFVLAPVVIRRAPAICRGGTFGLSRRQNQKK